MKVVVLLSSAFLGRGSNKRLSPSLERRAITSCPSLLTVRPPDQFGLPAHSRARRVLPESQCTFLTKVHSPADEPSCGIKPYFPTCSSRISKTWVGLSPARPVAFVPWVFLSEADYRSNGTATRHETHAAFPVVVLIALDYTTSTLLLK